MFSIALIGADGAGKTTIANKIKNELQLPIKYLYMGINVESSNVALPTSRFVQFIKNFRQRDSQKNSGSSKSSPTSLHNRSSAKRTGGKLRASARLVNRLLEEWYRQFISWRYRKRGFVVLYDRHFIFDFFENGHEFSDGKMPMSDKIHRWSLQKFYPRPDLTIYLDAPAEVLYARKEEATIEYLEARRRAFNECGKITKNFFKVDATQPLERVYSIVAEHIMNFSNQFQNR